MRVGRDDLEPAGIVRGDLLQRADARARRARSRSRVCAPSASSARVSPPGPGPISTTVAPSSGPAARAMRAVRLRSSRKFWPSDLRADRPWRRMTSRSGGRSSIALMQSACRLRPPCARRAASAAIRLDGLARAGAGDVEGGAVIRRGADERQAERDVDGVVERQRLDRDQRLIVIHAERAVVGLARGRVEHRVGGQRPARVDALGRSVSTAGATIVDVFACRACRLRRHAD